MLRIYLAALFLFLFSSLASAANPNGVAVIIGNKNYQGDLPSVDYAHRDAEAIRRYVVEVLEFDPANIIDLRDATKAQMEAAFGNSQNHRGRLWRYADPDGNSDIVIFYSGHGVPGQRDAKGYLLPANASPFEVEINGYPLEILYKNLNLVKARSKVVLLDSCFSGLSHGGSLIRSASPIFVAPVTVEIGAGTAVLTAAAASQLASWDAKSEHGLFTEYFLRGVYGEADSNADGKVRLSEIKKFLDGSMTRIARRQYGREQNATLDGETSLVLSSFEPGEPPQRPEIDTAALTISKPAASEVIPMRQDLKAPEPVIKPAQPETAAIRPQQVDEPSKIKGGDISRFNGQWEWVTTSSSNVCSLLFGESFEIDDGKFNLEISHLMDPGLQLVFGKIDKTGKISGFAGGNHVGVEMEGQAEGLRALGVFRSKGDVNCEESWIAFKAK